MSDNIIGRFESPHAISHVVVVGLGGTGSQLARSVARIVYDMSQRRMHIPRVTFIDPDTVEEKNVGRQMFTPADVGHNKAELLARRFNLALGLDIAAIPEAFDPEHHPHGRSTLLVGCVDNHLARRALAQAHGFWIDCGNHYESGQVVAGNCGDRDILRRSLRYMAEHDGVIRDLPNVSLVFPELLEPEQLDQTKPDTSCADLIEAGAQHILINDMVATIAAGYVYRMLFRKPLTNFLSYISLDAVRPISISSQELTTYTAS